MNKCKIHIQAIGDQGGTFSASGVGGDNDSFPVTRNVRLDVILDQSLAVKVIDGDIKETLVLGIMQVHRNDVVGTSAGNEVGDQGTSLGNPMLVTRLGLESIDVVWILIVVGGVTPQRGS